MGASSMKINKKYLMPNYHVVAEIINEVHGANYTNRHIKHIHSGKQRYTFNTLKVEIESLIGPYLMWYGEDNKPRFNDSQTA